MGWIARVIGVTIATFLIATSAALVIAGFFTPLYTAEIVQTSSQIVTQEYKSHLELNWRNGWANDQFGAKVWDENKYEDGSDGLMFRKCPSMYNDWRQAYILCVLAAIFACLTVALWIASAFLPRRKHKWSLFLVAIISCIATVGFLTSPAIMFIGLWKDRQYCLREFAMRGGSGAAFNYNDPSWAYFQKRGFAPQDDPTTQPGGNSNIQDARFYNILTSMMQFRMSQYSKQDQWEIRKDIALGYLGTVYVRQLKESHTPKMIIAAWVFSIAASVFGLIWLGVMLFMKQFCSTPKAEPFS